MAELLKFPGVWFGAVLRAALFFTTPHGMV